MKKYFIAAWGILFQNLAFGAVFNIADGDVAGLISAIVTSNTNDESDVINLAAGGMYILTTVNYTSSNPGTTGYEGQRGLPKILEDVAGLDLVINGNGATVMRAADAPNFGLFAIKGHTKIYNLIFRNARVNAQGAAVFVEFKGHVELYNCAFYDNESLIDTEGGGGAVYTKSLSTLYVDSCHFEGNKAVNQGGAISNLLSNLTVLNSVFRNNSTTDLTGTDPAGGAIYDDGARGDNGFLVIRNCLFEGNSCGKGKGGGVFLFPYNNNSAEVTNCVFRNNSAASGAGYWHDGGALNLADPFNEYNFTGGPENTTLTFHSCIFEANNATSQGGGVWIRRGWLSEVYNCTFTGNTAFLGNDGLGGGAFFITERPLVIRNCTFNDNVSHQAGGVFFGQTKTVQVINCTFDHNIANAYGGAVAVPANDTARAVTFINCTFANNEGNHPTAGQAGAIHSGNVAENNSVTIKNCLFYNQSVTNPWDMALNCNATLNDGGNNLFFPESTNRRCVSTPNPLIADPLLFPLADNGGPTKTMALQEGSPAIDAGSGCPQFDQRGAPRVGNCDIGAFEFGSYPNLGTAVPPKPKTDVLVYPNPTHGEFVVDLRAPHSGNMRIFSPDGKLIYDQRFDNVSLIPVHFEKKGLFILQLTGEGLQFVTKILAQ